jgi:hypothetical protein
MRKIRIFEHTSLHGVISSPGDSDFANGGEKALAGFVILHGDSDVTSLDALVTQD